LILVVVPVGLALPYNFLVCPEITVGIFVASV
jgi:hypothetical protein